MLLTLSSAVILESEFLVLVTIFYCLRYETSLFVTSYDSQGYGGGIRPSLHAGIQMSESESELLYDWRFTANQFVLTPSPLRLTARIVFLK
jgi:hypothetical protein